MSQFLQYKDLKESKNQHKVTTQGKAEVKPDPGSIDFPPSAFSPLLCIIFLTCFCSIFFFFQENQAEAKGNLIV